MRAQNLQDQAPERSERSAGDDGHPPVIGWMDTGLSQLLHACKANCGYPGVSETTTETNGALLKFLGEALMDPVMGWRRKDKEREQKRASWSLAYHLVTQTWPSGLLCVCVCVCVCVSRVWQIPHQVPTIHGIRPRTL